MSERELPNRFDDLFFKTAKLMLRVGGIIGYRVRCHNSHKLPRSGRGLVCANHQSNLDPVAIGITCHRDIHFLAKKSLFDRGPLKYIKHGLHCIPIDRDRGISGIRATIRRLRAEHLVLMFPEGARSLDGELQQFKSGFLTIARKTRSPLIPVGIEGAFDAYPPGQSMPLPGHIHVVFGDPIPFEQFADLDDKQAIRILESSVRECFETARRKREHHISLNIRERQPRIPLTRPVHRQDLHRQTT